MPIGTGITRMMRRLSENLVFSSFRVNSWSDHSRCWFFLTLGFFSPLPQKMKSVLPILYFCLTNSNSKCLVLTCIIRFLNLAWNFYLKRLQSADVNMGKQELLLLKRANRMFWKRLAGCAAKGWPQPGPLLHWAKGCVTLPENLLLYCSLVIKSHFQFFFIR